MQFHSLVGQRSALLIARVIALFTVLKQRYATALAEVSADAKRETPFGTKWCPALRTRLMRCFRQLLIEKNENNYAEWHRKYWIKKRKGETC